MPTATANGKTFTFPEGVTPEQMGEAIDEYFAANDAAEPIQQDAPANTRKRGGRSANAGNRSIEPTDPNQGTALDAVYEPIKAIAGGAVNQSISGLAGLGNVIQSYDSAQGTQRIEEVQNALPDFSPQTEAGKKGLQTIGDLMQAGIDIVNFPISGLAGLASLISGGSIDDAAATVKGVQDNGLGQTLGDKAFEATNNPALATAAMMLPDAAAAIVGGKAAKSGIDDALARLPKKPPVTLIDDTGRASKQFKAALKDNGVTLENIFPEDLAGLPANVTPKQAASMIVAKKIKEGSTDGYLAAKKIDSSGSIIDDQAAINAIKQGYEAGDVQAIKVANDATKNGMRAMVDMRRKIHGNTFEALDKSPSDVIGRSAMDRVLYIKDKATQSAKELNALVDGKLKGQTVNTGNVVSRLKDELDNIGVKFDLERPSKIEDWARSEISKDPAAQRVINDTIDLLSERGPADAQRAHKVKKQLDRMIDFKRNSFDLTPTGERIAQAIRAELNEAVRSVSPEYAKINDTLKDSLTALDDFQTVMGKKFDIADLNASSKAGLDLRKMISKYKVKEDQRSAISQLDDVANALGGNFRDDIKQLTQFNKILEKRFGPVEQGSFSPEVEQAIRRGLNGKDGAKEAALDKATDFVKEKLMNRTDYEAFMALRDLTGKAKQTRSGRSIVKKQ